MSARSLGHRKRGLIAIAGLSAVVALASSASPPTVSRSAAATPSGECPPATSTTGDSDGVFFLPIGDDQSTHAEKLTIPITFTAPTCRASVRITAARGVNRSFAFPAPGQKTERAFRVGSANTCQLEKVQQISPSTATAHRCLVQVLTVRLKEVGGDRTAKSTRASCLSIVLVARKSGPTGRAKRERTHVAATAERTDSLFIGGTLTLRLRYPKGASTDGASDVAFSRALVKQCNK